MNKLDVYRQLLRDTIRDDMQIEDTLLRACVLHTHAIALRTGISLDDVRFGGAEECIVLAPLTRSHVAELLSSLWPKDQERGAKGFWLTRYNALTPYEVFEDIPEHLRDRAIAARESIAAHDFVQRLIEE